MKGKAPVFAESIPNSALADPRKSGKGGSVVNIYNQIIQADFKTLASYLKAATETLAVASGAYTSFELNLPTVVKEYSGTVTTPFELTVTSEGAVNILLSTVAAINANLSGHVLALMVNGADALYTFFKAGSEFRIYDDLYVKAGDVLSIEFRCENTSGSPTNLELSNTVFIMTKL